jgi:hypothetical protein
MICKFNVSMRSKLVMLAVLTLSQQLVDVIHPTLPEMQIVLPPQPIHHRGYAVLF